MGLWAPMRWYPLQCDFSAMISPDMFAEFVLPDLAEQCDTDDRCQAEHRLCQAANDVSGQDR